MNPVRILIQSALVLGVSLAPALAQPTPPPAPGAAPEAAKAEGVVRRLKLTEAQRASLQAVRQRHAEALRGGRQALRQARHAFREALRNPDTPVEQLRPLHQALAQRQFELIAERRTMRGEMRALLTPEQREEAARLRAR